MTPKSPNNSESKPSWSQIALGAPASILNTEYETGSWRSFRPEYQNEACINCGTCWISCPDDAILWTPEKRTSPREKTGVIAFKWNACKGCGVCAKVCPKQAITMIREEEE